MHREGVRYGHLLSLFFVLLLGLACSEVTRVGTRDVGADGNGLASVDGLQRTSFRRLSGTAEIGRRL